MRVYRFVRSVVKTDRRRYDCTVLDMLGELGPGFNLVGSESDAWSCSMEVNDGGGDRCVARRAMP